MQPVTAAAAGRLKLDGMTAGTLCHETIYQHAYGPEGREAGLWRHLPKVRRQRRPVHGRKPRVSFVPPDRSIAQRPPAVLDRGVFGHWEGDLLIFQKAHGKANLASMVERQTRFAHQCDIVETANESWRFKNRA